MERLSLRVFVIGLCLAISAFVFLHASQLLLAGALNINTYADLISDSKPGAAANHTFTFELKEDVAAGGYFEFDFPTGFELPATSTFAARSVEMYVDGVARSSSDTLSSSTDQVILTTGDGGSVRYVLATANGITADADIEVRIGNHTSTAIPTSQVYSTSTGTTTVPGDPIPITNPDTAGNQEINLTVSGTDETTYADFIITLIEPISIADVDTTEEIPPFRFNGAPTGTIGGTTQFVEISLETDEFAVCKYSQTASTSFQSMSNTFDDTGLIFHSQLVAVATSSQNTYYVRCIDDEGNFNITDYTITFFAPDEPTGISNEDGQTDGDGSGSGDAGAGGGDGSGSSENNSGGGGSGGSSGGGGGSGGGSGGSSGDDDEDEVGGGFESSDGPYPSGEAEIVIRGYAFPGSTVYGLVDGSQVESTDADSDGSFSMTLEEIARGVYTFGVYAVGDDDVKSSTFSTSFTVTGGRTSNLSNVNVAPSILVEPDPVDVGADLTISGYAIPNAEITLENQKEGSAPSLKTLTTSSDDDGVWSIDVDTSGFSNGTYKVRARAESDAVSTNFSDYTFYGVGEEADVPSNSDLNTDGSVNLTDFSILLFWWGTDGGDSDPPADINQDGDVSLTDFSILLFNWTG